MNSKERMLAVFQGRQPDLVPAAPHWWGNYKYEVAGKDYWLDCWGDGASIVPIYQAFFERFQPDWFHLHGGYPRRRGAFASNEWRAVQEGERRFLIAPDGSRDEILPDQGLASWEHSRPPRPDLSSRDAIDEHVARYEQTSAQEIIEAGYTDAAAEIVRRYGDRAFICVHIGAPSILVDEHRSGGYEASLLALYDHPEGVKYLLQRRYALSLEWAKAFASVGVHGWAISEGYSGADTISPRTYEEFLHPVDCWYYAEVRKLGLVPMVYFCGDLRPMLPLLRESGVGGLIIEESRKTFELDVVEITRVLQGKVALFGNIDTCELLLKGTPEEVEAAVKAQLAAAREGPFLVCNGSPFAPGTPPENVDAMIRAARRYGRL